MHTKGAPCATDLWALAADLVAELDYLEPLPPLPEPAAWASVEMISTHDATPAPLVYEPPTPEAERPARHLGSWERCDVPGCQEEALFFAKRRQLCPVHADRLCCGRPLDGEAANITVAVQEAALAFVGASSLDDGQDFLARRERIEALAVEYARAFRTRKRKAA